MDGIDSKGQGLGWGVAFKVTLGDLLSTKSMWGLWKDGLPSLSHRPTGFLIDLLLRNTDWCCVWLSLNKALLLGCLFSD